MTCQAFTVPLRPPTPLEIESRHSMVKSYEYYRTPIDEAVEAVREAQDACGKGIWEDK